MEENPGGGEKIISEIQVDGIGLGTMLDNRKLGKHYPGHRSTSVAAGQETCPSSQVKSEDDSSSSHDRVNRLAIAFQDGRYVRFVPNGKYGSYDAFAADLEMNLDDPGNGIEGEGDNLPQTSRQVIYSSPGQPIVNIPYRGVKDRSRSTALVVNRDENDENIKDNEWEEDIENEKECSRKWKHEIAAADKRFRSENEVLNQGCTITQREPRPRKGRARSIAGEIVAVHGQAGIEWDHVSPIPLNFHNHGRKTPSVHSNGTEQDCSSPLFPKSCQTVLMQAYQELPPAAERTFLEVEVESFDNQLAQDPLSSDIKVSKWLRQIPSHEKNGPSNSACQKDDGKALDIFEDVQPERSMQRNSKKRVAARNALKDITNLRRPGYLHHNSFFSERKATEKRDQSVYTAKESSDEAAETKAYQSSQPNASTFREPSSISSLASARQALEGVVIGDSPSPSSSPSKASSSTSEASKGETEVSSKVNSSRAADQAFALARLEGRVAPKPSSPIQVFVNPAWRYGMIVEVEDEGPSLLQPKPRGGFHLMKIVAYLEALVRGWLGFGAAVPDGYSVTADGSLIQRPANPTPRRAQR